MSIESTIAEVLRLDGEAKEPLPICEMCRGQGYVMLNGNRAHCGRCPRHDLTALHAYYRTAAPALAQEVERLRAEVGRLTPIAEAAHDLVEEIEDAETLNHEHVHAALRAVRGACRAKGDGR